MALYGVQDSMMMNRRDYTQPGCSSWDDRSHPDPYLMSPPPATPSPWTSAGLSWGSVPHSYMNFSANAQPSTMVHCKRKPEDFELPIPAKQLITEERMAAHLRGMHISHNFTSHGAPSPQTASSSEQQQEMDVQEWPHQVSRVVLSDEIKRLREEPIIPPQLIERLEKPCMCLMVWKPKDCLHQDLPDLPSSDDEDDIDQHNPSKASRARPGVLVTEIFESDQDTMDVEM